MYKQLLRRFIESIITLFFATLILFIVIRLAPGDPIQLRLGQPFEVAINQTEMVQEKADSLREKFGLNQSVASQYIAWLKRLLYFDFGQSIHSERHISTELTERLPATMMLSIAALCIQVLLGLVFGILSAVRAGKTEDNIIRVFCILVASTPAFVVALCLLFLFAVTLAVYEIGSAATFSRLWLPAMTLGLIGAPQFIRIIRANILSELGQIYVHAAIARGLNQTLILKHALRNCLLPLITLIALSFSHLISGAVVIESIFSWPGIGKYALDSILLKDYPVIQGYALITVCFVVVIHAAVDIMNIMIDPRLRPKGVAQSENEHKQAYD